MATRRDEARRGELNVRRVKLVPNSPRLVDWTPHLASPRGEARQAWGVARRGELPRVVTY